MAVASIAQVDVPVRVIVGVDTHKDSHGVPLNKGGASDVDGSHAICC